MNNWVRLGISALISLILTVTAFFLFPGPSSPSYFVLPVYYFAPGAYLSDFLPGALVNAVGEGLITVVLSGVIWALVIFGLWLLITRLQRRS